MSSLQEHIQKEVIFVRKMDMGEERKEADLRVKKEVIDAEVDLENVDTATSDHEVHLQMMRLLRLLEKHKVIATTIVIIDIAINLPDKKRRLKMQEIIVDVSLMRLRMRNLPEIKPDRTRDLEKTDHQQPLVIIRTIRIISGCQDIDKRIVMGDWDMMRVWTMYGKTNINCGMQKENGKEEEESNQRSYLKEEES